MNILTFDIEEWFHILFDDPTNTSKEWQQYESRIHANMERIFQVLDDAGGVKATFFCLGWIADKYPDIIKSIVNKGYEIGTHTDTHQPVYGKNPKAFSMDIERSVKTLEDIGGKKIRCFRAPAFSIREDNRWVFDILVKLGITIDSSVFPVPRWHGGLPSYRTDTPAFIQYDGIRLKEFPISYTNVFGRPLAYSGGGYFRLLPYSFIKKCAKKSPYVMTYFHPRDFDVGQPVIKEQSISRKFKSYVGISGAYNKLKKFMNDFDFIDIDTADKLINWDDTRVITV